MERPPLNELPAIVDARVSGLRLQGTSAKALPPMPVVDLGGKGRMLDAAQKAAEMKIAYAEDRARNKAREKAQKRLDSRKQRIVEQAATKRR
tara:strand:- start:483 stop:758 length:276 start_codon:yes stop_codon:yes gene_type:complete